jgi:hypothetical protein
MRHLNPELERLEERIAPCVDTICLGLNLFGACNGDAGENSGDGHSEGDSGNGSCEGSGSGSSRSGNESSCSASSKSS